MLIISENQNHPNILVKRGTQKTSWTERGFKSIALSSAYARAAAPVSQWKMGSDFDKNAPRMGFTYLSQWNFGPQCSVTMEAQIMALGRGTHTHKHTHTHAASTIGSTFQLMKVKSSGTWRALRIHQGDRLGDWRDCEQEVTRPQCCSHHGGEWVMLSQRGRDGKGRGVCLEECSLSRRVNDGKPNGSVC